MKMYFLYQTLELHPRITQVNSVVIPISSTNIGFRRLGAPGDLSWSVRGPSGRKHRFMANKLKVFYYGPENLKPFYSIEWIGEDI